MGLRQRRLQFVDLGLDVEGPELDQIREPELKVTGRCEDCESMVSVTVYGTCVQCGGSSIWRPGGVATMEAARKRHWASVEACWRW